MTIDTFQLLSDNLRFNTMLLLIGAILCIFILLAFLFNGLYFNKRKSELSSLQKSRKFTAMQREEFLKMLYEAPRGTVNVTAVKGDSESIAFAKEIDGLLNTAGWITHGVRQAFFTRNPDGLILTVKSAEQSPPYADFLLNALKAIGLPTSAEIDSENTIQSLTLIVGHNKNSDRWLSVQFFKKKQPRRADAAVAPADQYWSQSQYC